MFTLSLTWTSSPTSRTATVTARAAPPSNLWPVRMEALHGAFIITALMVERVMSVHEFLVKHPTPWRLDQGPGDGTGHGTVIAANESTVICSQDADHYASWLVGDIGAFIDFINEVGSRGVGER